MRIGELATRTGVSVRALRYYEEHDLLAAERSPSGQRLYAQDAVDRVLLIQQLYAAGLSSRTIVELLPCVVDGDATPNCSIACRPSGTTSTRRSPSWPTPATASTPSSPEPRRTCAPAAPAAPPRRSVSP